MFRIVVASSLAIASTVSGASVDPAGANASAGRVVRVEATVDAPSAAVWREWTTSEGAQEFFAPRANIQLAIGGPYEIYFDPTDESKGTKGLKVLSYLPEQMISFQWNAPPDMPEVRRIGTWVVVQIRPEGADKSHVTISHLGFQEGPEWDRAYQHFVRGWGDLVERLKLRFSEGPIDWKQEVESHDKQQQNGFTLKQRANK